MLAFTPLFLIGTAAVILHEIPSAIGVLGIIVIRCRLLCPECCTRTYRPDGPVPGHGPRPGVFSMLVVAFLYAVVINFDKMVVTNSDTVFGSGIVFSLLGAAFLGIFLLKQFIGRFRGRIASEAAADPATPRATGTWRDLATAALIVGIFLTIETVAINQAYLQQIVPYVSAIKKDEHSHHGRLWNARFPGKRAPAQDIRCRADGPGRNPDPALPVRAGNPGSRCGSHGPVLHSGTGIKN